MQPSLNLQYPVQNHKLYLSSQDLENLKAVSELYNKMISDVLELSLVNFLSLKNPRLNYAEQQNICHHRVLLATASLIHYGLHPEMLIKYLKGEYMGEIQDPD